jgi:uncharacterized delta-60 repeat protein
MFIKSFFKKHILLTAALIVLSLNVNAQGVDPAYTPYPAVDAILHGGLIVPLAGGKLLVLAYYGDFSAPLERVLIKINVDGSLDTFNCTACDFEIYGIAVQPDGKFLVSGYTPSGSRFIRINPDGSLDATFSNPFSAIPNNVNAFIHAVLPDGRIYASVKKSGASTGNGALYRVNTDGSIDNSFTPLVYNEFEFNNYIRQIIPLPDGKIYVLGKHQNFGHLFRLNSDGSLDNGFASPIFGNIFDMQGRPLITSGVLQPDGKLVVAGMFSGVNSIDRNCVVRLNPDGGVDGAFHSIQFIGGGSPAYIAAQSDGKIIVHKYSTDGRIFHRLNADLTTDPTFTGPIQTEAGSFAIDSNDKVVYLLGTLTRLNTDGSVDNTVSFSLPVPGKVAAIALQADGKAIISGEFKYLNGTTRPTIGRLNTDGTTDATFVSGTGFDHKPYELRVQADGKILALGDFNSYNGTARAKLARLNADGSLDGTFTPSIPSTANSIELQPDGKILVLGGSMGINGFGRTGVARLNSDGTLDTSFNPVISSPTVWVAVVQPDGKIVFGGTFGTVNGVSRPNLARLNADGSLDLTFTPANIGNTYALARQPDGKYLVGSINPGILKRLNADGSLDASFNPPAIAGGALITSIVVETGGSIVVAGQFSQPRPNIFRVNASGAFDIAFAAGGANGIVLDLARQADNKVIAVGEFKSIGGVSRAGIARFNFTPFRAETPFDFDGDGIADISLTRPGDFNWYQLTGVNYNFGAIQFGQPGDKVTPADFDGDGKTDIGVFRPATGDWWYRKSTDGLQYSIHWGQNGDIPLAADYNGDGKADVAAVRNYVWWIANITNGQTLQSIAFGQAGDKLLVGDFDGDGKTDPAVYRPSEGTWYYAASSNNYVHTGFQWGVAEDIPVPADYDGDGKTDGAVFRPSEGNWYVLNSSNGTWIGLHFGLTGDKPIAADYDGDGKADIAVYRPSDHYWYILGTTAGFYGFPFGLETDIPSPNAFIQP